jgi:hypothetical protein
MRHFRDFRQSVIEGFGRKEYQRPTKLPLSEHPIEDVVGLHYWHHGEGFKPHTVEVHPSKLRATQKRVDTRWTPGTITKGESKPDSIPAGIMKPDGTVHLSDGHHRAEHALTSGADNIKVSVFNADNIPKYKPLNERERREQEERRRNRK